MADVFRHLCAKVVVDIRVSCFCEGAIFQPVRGELVEPSEQFAYLVAVNNALRQAQGERLVI